MDSNASVRLKPLVITRKSYLNVCSERNYFSKLTPVIGRYGDSGKLGKKVESFFAGVELTTFRIGNRKVVAGSTPAKENLRFTIKIIQLLIFLTISLFYYSSTIIIFLFPWGSFQIKNFTFQYKIRKTQHKEKRNYYSTTDTVQVWPTKSI